MTMDRSRLRLVAAPIMNRCAGARRPGRQGHAGGEGL